MTDLPPNLATALLAYDSPMAIPTEVNHEAAIVAKVPATEIPGFGGAPVRYQYALGRYETGPVIALMLDILDDPRRPFGLEVFLDVAKPADLALARKLAQQTTFVIHFYDFRLAYQFSKRLRHRATQRRELGELIRLALDHLEKLDPGAVDWYAARLRFQQEVPR